MINNAKKIINILITGMLHDKIDSSYVISILENEGKLKKLNISKKDIEAEFLNYIEIEKDIIKRFHLMKLAFLLNIDIVIQLPPPLLGNRRTDCPYGLQGG